MLRQLSAIFLGGILLSGCSTGFNRIALQERLESRTAVNPTDDTRIPKLPIKVALYMDIEQMRDVGNYQSAGRLAWSREDKKLVLEYLRDSVKLTVVDKDYIILKPGEASDVETLSGMAKEQGCSALLLIRGETQVDSYFNPSAILDLTLIGATLVPGSNRNVLLMVHGDLIELETGHNLWKATATEENAIEGPTLVIDTEDAMAPIRRSALRKVMKSFYRDMIKRCPPAG